MTPPTPGFTTVYPRGEGAAHGTMPAGYIMVSRWVSGPEVKLWMANGGTFIPPGVGRLGGRVAVIPFGASKPAGVGADSVIRIDFGVPEKAVQMAGEGRQILQPLANTPIYNVSIHIPTNIKVHDVLRNRGI